MALILLVDDSNDDLEILKEFLESYSHSCQLATSGEEALALLKVGKFDLVISDFNMPNGNGLWVIRELKKLIDPPRCLMVTGEFRYSPEYIIQQGASGHCFKPVIWDQLKTEVDRLLF